MSLKVLSLGAAQGSIKALIEKQRTLQAKHNFDLCVVVGDFFGSPNAVEGRDEIDELLSDSLNVSVITYIMLGENPLPSKIKAKVEKTGGEICSNLFFLGKSGVLTTAQGLKIATVGGTWNAELYDSPSSSSSASQEVITSQDIQSLLSSPHLPLPPKSIANSLSEASAAPIVSTTGIDLLLLESPPPFLALPSLQHFPLAEPANPLAEIVRRGRPRYILWAGGEGFWEREPFGWGDADSGKGRYSRAVKLGRFGGDNTGPGPEGKKARSFYAFTLPPLNPPPPKPANITTNPFTSAGPRGEKRGPPLESQNFIFNGTGQGGSSNKRNRTDGGEKGPPPSSYICKICFEPGHWIQECPQKQPPKEPSATPPENYVCRICAEPGHWIKDCPQKTDRPATEGGVPENYKCNICGEKHWIKDCPQKGQSSGGVGKKAPPLGPDECWFCLMNPKVTKHLIVSIGSETYVTLPKGQLPPTSSKLTQATQDKITGLPVAPKVNSPVPGGGHVLIIPIQHYPTLLSVPAEEAIGIVSEIERYKSALRSCYASFNAVPVSFEVGRLSGRGGHAHVQIIPIPRDLEGLVEKAFREEGEKAGYEWEADTVKAMDRAKETGNYFKVDLPSGGRIVHLIKPTSRFDLQFGRTVLANLMGMSNRIDWKACAQTDAEEKADALAFKKAFSSFDPTK